MSEPGAAAPPALEVPARSPARKGASFLRQTLRRCRGAFLGASVFSFFINLLMLTGSIYSLQVFDRVLSSRSISTLIYLSLLAGLALVFLWFLDLARAQVMTAVGTWFDERVGPRLMAGTVAGTGPVAPGPGAAQPLRDLIQIRNFLVGPNLFPVMDVPWAPVMLLMLFALHPYLGYIALAGAGLLILLAVAGDLWTKQANERAAALNGEGLYDAETAARNVDSIRAMGLMPMIAQRWKSRNSMALGYARHAALRSNLLGSLSRLVRQMLQIAMLGVGAWLTLKGEVSGGALIASSILVGRALAPVEMAVGALRQAVAARQAYKRIGAFIDQAEAQPPQAVLFRAKGRLTVEDVIYVHPNTKEPTLKGISFALEPGESLAVMGPSGSGKTTLSRVLAGAVRANAGAARLDGVDIAAWNPEDRGTHTGYLPQTVELFRGTIEDNIARLRVPDAAMVVAAAELARAHEMIQALPNGYKTEIGEGGLGLSGGQRQKIGLARALYGDPKFVVMDEPNANLDQQGEAALSETMRELKRRAVSVAVVTHRPSVIDVVDKILILRDGKVLMFGPRAEVLARLAQQQQSVSRLQPVPKPGASHG
jgi:PrtD family type I secretion system ABC transporter